MCLRTGQRAGTLGRLGVLGAGDRTGVTVDNAEKTRPGARRAAAIAVVVAVASGVAGLGLAFTGEAEPRVTGSVGRAGDLTLAVDRGNWVAHEMDMGASPQMAMEGMPPDGFRRLHLEVALTNSGAEDRSFGPDQFRVRSDGRAWRLASSSFVTGALSPGQAMAGDLFFDVPAAAADAELALSWTPPGRRLLLLLDDALGTAGHRHHDHSHDRGDKAGTDRAGH